MNRVEELQCGIITIIQLQQGVEQDWNLTGSCVPLRRATQYPYRTVERLHAEKRTRTAINMYGGEPQQ